VLSELAQGKAKKCHLGEFDVESVDFLGADVANEERGLPGTEARPGGFPAKLVGKGTKFLQAEDLFEF